MLTFPKGCKSGRHTLFPVAAPRSSMGAPTLMGGGHQDSILLNFPKFHQIEKKWGTGVVPSRRSAVNQ